MDNVTAFVGGVHGSGKSTLCRNICSHIVAEHITASSLIARRKKLDEKKAVSNIDDNQQILISEFNKFVRGKQKVLLDGHFSLLKPNGEIDLVPAMVFEKLKLEKILIVTCDALRIHKRLLERDKSTHHLNVEAIESFQKTELEHSRYVSSKLKLDLLEVDVSSNADALDSAIDFLVGRK